MISSEDEMKNELLLPLIYSEMFLVLIIGYIAKLVPLINTQIEKDKDFNIRKDLWDYWKCQDISLISSRVEYAKDRL